MTHVQRLYMKGFKSFAKPVDLTFGKNFNVCIGPNGSGKSNIMDALTFVLGKTSAKSMRAEKSANLIFNGGKKGSAMKEAEVSIYFDNTDKEFPVDSRTVKLTRLVRPNGNSLYKINDEARTRQQIVELLGAASIDPDGHNIILQGDIIHFMSMHPEERRQVIEEIAGISIYEDRKQKAMNELGRVEQRLNDAELILNERANYLKELKKERDHALKYKDTEDRIKSNKATYLDLQISDKKEKLEDIEKKVSEHQNGINKVNEVIKEARDKIEAKKQELQSIEKDIEQKSEVESVSLQKSIEDLKTDIVRTSERLNTCKNEVQKVEDRKKQLAVGLKDIDNNISGLEKSNKELSIEEHGLIKQENDLDIKIKRFKEAHGLGNQEELVKLESEIEKKEEFVFKLQDEKQDFLKEKYQIDAKINNIGERIEDLKKNESKTNIKDLKKELKVLDEEYKKLLTENSSLDNQLQKARREIGIKNEDLSRWQVRQAGVNETLMGDLATRKILELNKKGVYGLVSELGTVNNKYALALEVAAGPRIKSLVVEDDKIAAECIKYLKQYKLGTATFLPLNTIKARKEVNLSGKGIHGSAMELITFDNKFKNIFSYVFGGTVVIDDVDIARKMGVGKARMVTLEGDLFELSGAIIGGFRKKSRGLSFQQQQADDRLGILDKEISELKDKIITFDKRKDEVESNLRELRNRKSEIEGEIIKSEKSLGGVNLEQLQKELENLEKEDIFEDVKNIESRIDGENKELEELKQRRHKLRGNAAGLSGEKENNFNDLENKKQIVHERVIQLRTELKNIEAQIKNIYIPEREKTEQILKEHEKELENFKKESIDLTNKLKEQNSTLRETESHEKKFKKEYQGLFEKRGKFGQDIQKFESSISVQDIRIRELQDRINNLAINKAKLTAEFEALNNEYEEYKGAKLRRGVAVEVLKDETRRLEQSMRQMGNVNLRALEVYENVQKEYDGLLMKKDTLKSEQEDIMGMIMEIEKKKKGIFMKTYKGVSENFKQIFLSLSRKGEAFLELENKEEPLQGGLDIKVRITGNKYMDIKSLSGGEKTLVSLAFIFAIQEYQPASFYLLDEVDAALDKKNAELLSGLIKKYAGTAQYILISHNDSVITEADQIYGVSMQENGISKIISLKI
ncbi:MAG: chromosome segregation protein SMC [Candidatus Nanoarchaeia archaeon]|nr:chromosome segregation protein SMC [Candidatus Nanoarchaeia archaeon]